MTNFLSALAFTSILIIIIYLSASLGIEVQRDAFCEHLKYELKVKSRLCKEGK